MKCPFCGQEHPDNSKFCLETGKPLQSQIKKCEKCGYENVPIEAKFCPRCGSPFLETTKSANNIINSIIILKTDYDNIKFIDTNGNFLYEQSFKWLNDYSIHEYKTAISDLIVADGNKAYLVSNNGKLIEICTYNNQCEIVESIYGQYILVVQNRSAILYKKDSQMGLILISQIRLKYERIAPFDIVGDYISFFYYKNGFASINIKTGEKLETPGYKYSMLLAILGNETFTLASNDNEQLDSFVVLGKDGNIIHSFPKGEYYPNGTTENLNFLKLCNNVGFGLVSFYGEEIIPPYFYKITIQDKNHLLLHIGNPFVDMRNRDLEYNLKNKSFITNDYYDEQKIICRGEKLPTSLDELDEILESYSFGFGKSSDYKVEDGKEIVRRADRKVIYHIDENEYPIGASDNLKRFGIYDQEYLTIYDNDGKVLYEHHASNGIVCPRLYANGIILFFDKELKELYIIDENFELTSIQSAQFNGSHDVIYRNCIVVDLWMAQRNVHKLYNIRGKLILPEKMNVISWKKLNEQYAIVEVAENELCLSRFTKKGVLINLLDNKFVQIPIPYENAYILK